MLLQFNISMLTLPVQSYRCWPYQYSYDGVGFTLHYMILQYILHQHCRCWSYTRCVFSTVISMLSLHWMLLQYSHIDVGPTLDTSSVISMLVLREMHLMYRHIDAGPILDASSSQSYQCCLFIRRFFSAVISMLALH